MTHPHVQMLLAQAKLEDLDREAAKAWLASEVQRPPAHVYRWWERSLTARPAALAAPLREY